MLSARKRTYQIPGQPVPYDRAVTTTNRHTGKPMRIHSTRYRGWRSQARLDLYRQGGRYEGPVAVTIEVTATGCRLTVEPADVARPKGVRGDVDNYAKACLDALQAADIIGDDRQVVHLTVHFPTEEPQP